MSNEDEIVDIIARNFYDLEVSQLQEGITRFGGHPLVVCFGAEEVTFWSEFVRVNRSKPRSRLKSKSGNNESMAFRVITRMKEYEAYEQNVVRGIRAFEEERIQGSRIAVLDHRTNIERELEPGTKQQRPAGSMQSEELLEEYHKLRNGEIDVLLTPIREGALGPTEQIGNVGPYTEREFKNDPRVWDIEEELHVARTLQNVFSGERGIQSLEAFRSQVIGQYKEFALPLAQMLNADLRLLHLEELPESSFSDEVDLSFFDDTEEVRSIDLGFGPKRVERVVAYPYPTEHGIVYASLFRVWNVQDDEFEVVRVLQTKSKLDHIDGLRIDSSCVDGVHSLDCHCDCKAQLEEALYEEGLDKGKNVVIIQMTDHEGKAWGSVLKGTGTHRPVREHNALYPQDPIHHVDVAAVFYHALGVPPDNRRYGAAQAVTEFLGIEYVEALFMDNRDKVAALEGIGLRFGEIRPLYPDESALTGEANRVNGAKKEGKVYGPDGKPVVYNGKTR